MIRVGSLGRIMNQFWVNAPKALSNIHDITMALGFLKRKYLNWCAISRPR